jgi:hypothetical protein
LCLCVQLLSADLRSHCPCPVRQPARCKRTLDLAVLRLAPGCARIRRDPASVVSHRSHDHFVLAAQRSCCSVAASTPGLRDSRLCTDVCSFGS